MKVDVPPHPDTIAVDVYARNVESKAIYWKSHSLDGEGAVVEFEFDRLPSGRYEVSSQVHVWVKGKPFTYEQAGGTVEVRR